MQKITAAMLAALLICGVCGIISGSRDVEAVTQKIIRIHIIANSDSDEDQALKLRVRDAVLSASSDLITKCDSKAEAEQAIISGLDVIETAAKKVVSDSGYDLDVKCTLMNEEFDEREYDGFTLPEGEYEALCIRIGEAKGHNWWCICYPSLCFGASSSLDGCELFTDGELTVIKEPQKVRYKLWCYELLRKIEKLFG